MDAKYLAFDLGAESGRAILGRFRDGVLDLTEIHRFSNRPVHKDGSLRWDIRAVWREMERGLENVNAAELMSVGVDTWGVDYALLDHRGELVEDPYHYRDRRTEGMMEAVFARVPQETIYSITGIQFLPFNTLFQLYAACELTPASIQNAAALATIPDLLNYWLTGKLVSEYTNATTTQLIDANSRVWATDLLDALGLPARLLLPIVEPGTSIGWLKNTRIPVIAPACHDTGSAVAAISLTGKTAFLSSGTWSLLGAELSGPVVTPLARDLNFTNEGGVCGTTRLLKNIAGLWLLQSCRRAWTAEGCEYDYSELFIRAQDSPSFRSLFDPDDPRFLNPPHMPAALAEYCRQTGQPPPSTPAEFTRAILESLAFKYRAVLESLEHLAGVRFEQIRVIGGGSKNRLLNQLTADATGRVVIAGPTEATALGNIVMQMLATGAVSTLAEGRQIVEQSFATETFEPCETDRWDTYYPRFRDHIGDARA
ncbi:MAG TPA: rhamnulokinase family protein [Bryobacteraceae bacterium]|jgi:rhamnulokinase